MTALLAGALLACAWAGDGTPAAPPATAVRVPYGDGSEAETAIANAKYQIERALACGARGVRWSVVRRGDVVVVSGECR